MVFGGCFEDVFMREIGVVRGAACDRLHTHTLSSKGSVCRSIHISRVHKCQRLGLKRMVVHVCERGV